MIKKVPQVLVFDINETLLDIGALTPHIASVLNGDEKQVPLWFSTLLHHSMVDTVTHQQHDFLTIGVAALQMVAHAQGVAISEAQARDVLSGPMTSLPPHPDVPDALRALRAAGFRLIAFSNSSASGLRLQLSNAKLTDYFDDVVSVEQTGFFKPFPEAYQWVLNKHQTDASAAMMVAAHGWDLCGAAAVGMLTAFVEREGKMPYPLGPAPTLSVTSLTALANHLIDR
ncbi:haloacid dehalogenase type II [Alteromonas sp. CYL-A6]|uniref:haloacid dehalogenase type II n=1 Tax=Alteromonas nitratireducens TaxID=3390813 RepID=UPI0034BD6C8E